MRNIWARQTGKTTDGQKEFFLVHLLKFESDTATSKNIAVISKPKFSIISHYLTFNKRAGDIDEEEEEDQATPELTSTSYSSYQGGPYRQNSVL